MLDIIQFIKKMINNIFLYLKTTLQLEKQIFQREIFVLNTQ